MSRPPAQALSTHIEDFLPTVLYQREVGVSSLVKIKPKYRNIIDVRLALSNIKPRILKPEENVVRSINLTEPQISLFWRQQPE